MKNQLLLNCILLTFFALNAFADTPERIYYYIVNVRNVPSESFIHNVASERVANVINKKQPGSCIDLRSQGSASSNNLIERDAIGILMNSSMTEATKKDLDLAVCQNSAENCTVGPISEQSFPISNLSITTYVPNGNSLFRSPGTTHELQGMIPKFSSGCDTGQYTDSWNNAAGTEEARAYVSRIGIDLDSVRNMALTNIDGSQEIYSFGFPRNSNANSNGSSGLGKAQPPVPPTPMPVPPQGYFPTPSQNLPPAPMPAPPLGSFPSPSQNLAPAPMPAPPLGSFPSPSPIEDPASAPDADYED